MRAAVSAGYLATFLSYLPPPSLPQTPPPHHLPRQHRLFHLPVVLPRVDLFHEKSRVLSSYFSLTRITWL